MYFKMICLICTLFVISIMPTNGDVDVKQLKKQVDELESTVKFLSSHLDKEQLKASNVSNQVGYKEFGSVR